MLSIAASVGVLFLGWEVGGAAQKPQSATTTAPTSDPTSTPSATATPAPTSTSKPATGSGLKDGSFTGTSVSTQFGDVQVAVTISGGKITNVTALKLTTYGGRSVQISNYAAPILRSEVLKAQSAKVSNVSGATYTTRGYLSSLQSALNQAKA
ncbi:MAG: hypothetical protein QOH69_2362 [Actinomycetota bacterium]|jgi:uncharacterized protein with FMN-binding domain|nr:hypothetical protein [Actinomycetota bacterium]